MPLLSVSFSFTPSSDVIAVLYNASGDQIAAIDNGFTETSAGNYTLSIEVSDYVRSDARTIKFTTQGGQPSGPVTLTEDNFADSGSGLGASRTLPKRRVYAVQRQTFDVTSSPRAATGAIEVISIAGISDGNWIKFQPIVDGLEIGDPEVWTFRDVLGLGPIDEAVVNNAGILYLPNDVLDVAGGTGGQIIVDTVSEGGLIDTYHVSAPGDGYGPGTPTAATSGSATGSGATFSITVIADPFEILISEIDEADQAQELNNVMGTAMVVIPGPPVGAVQPIICGGFIGALGNNNPVISTNASGLSLTQFTDGNDGGSFTVEYDGDPSAAINFDDDSAAATAALDVIPALTGHVTAVGVESGGAASGGFFRFLANPVDGDTMPAINGFTGIVFKDAAGDFPEIQIGSSLTETVNILGNQLNIHADEPEFADPLLSFDNDESHLLIRTDGLGPAGNSITLGASIANIFRSGPTLTGGKFGSFNIVLDSTITAPLLFVLGDNNLVDGVSEGGLDIFITNADILVTLATPAEGDIIDQVIVKSVERFSDEAHSPSATLEVDARSLPFADNNEGAVLRGPEATSWVLATDASAVPFVSEGGPVVLQITGAGGIGNVAGVCDAWIKVSTPG